MYKRLAIALFMVLSLIVSPFMGSVAQALSTLPYANSLVKIDGNPTVYWVATNGKRYVFPNPRTFYSWFSGADLASVITLSPQQLGSITIGGNVTYRPGVRLIKVTTDPKVYAVARYGVLRWITSEALAVQLYGQNWAQQVDDVPDEFFTNYRTGDAVYTASQFNVQYEMGLARSPSDNIPAAGNDPSYPPNNPPSAISGELLLSLNNANPSVGESVAFTARLANSTNFSSDITLSIFSITGETLLVCTNSLSCTHNWYMDSNLAGFGRSYYARVTHRNGQMRDSNTVTLQVRGTSANSGRPTVTVNNAYPRIGETVTLTATANDLNVQQGSLSLATHPEGTILQSCASNYTCTYSFVMTEAIANNMRTNSQGSYGYYARFFYSNRSSTDSPNVVRVYAPSVQNAYTPATSHVITFDRSTVRPGENFTVTARLSPDSTGAPYYTIRIYDQWNVLQHTCINVRTCVLQQTLSPTTDTSRTYYASAIADTGHSVGSGNATIQVIPSINSAGNGRLGNSQLTFSKSSDNVITLSPEMTVYSGAILRMGATIEPAASNAQGFKIVISDRNGTVLNTCSNTNTCSTETLMVNTGAENYTAAYKARVEDDFGSWYETPLSSVIVRPQQSNAFDTTLITSLGPTTVQSGQTFTLKAEAKNYNTSLENLAIAWYQEDGALITTCYARSTCDVGTSYPALNGTTRTMRFYVEAWDTIRTREGNERSDLHTVTIKP